MTVRATKPCVDCGAPCSRGSRGRCRPCGYAGRRKREGKPGPAPTCVECAGPVSRSSRTGRCIACFNRSANADPALKARRAEGIRRKFANDPSHRVKMANVVQENAARAMLRPERRAAAVARGQFLYREHLCRPEVRERNVAAIRANAWKISEAQIGWCPPEERELYRHLTRVKRLSAAEARAAVFAKLAADRQHRAPSPKQPKTFEEQLAAVDSGRAQVVPVLQTRREYDYTLAGVSEIA